MERRERGAAVAAGGRVTRYAACEYALLRLQQNVSVDATA